MSTDKKADLNKSASLDLTSDLTSSGKTVLKYQQLFTDFILYSYKNLSEPLYQFLITIKSALLGS